MNLEELDFEACIEQIEKLFVRAEKRFDKRAADNMRYQIVRSFFSSILNSNGKKKFKKIEEQLDACIDIIEQLKPKWLTRGKIYHPDFTALNGMVKKHALKFIKGK